MRADVQNNVDKIRKSLDLLAQRMDRETPRRLEEFNARVGSDLWNDPTAARKLMRERQSLVDAMKTYDDLNQELEDSIELINW